MPRLRILQIHLRLDSDRNICHLPLVTILCVVFSLGLMQKSCHSDSCTCFVRSKGKSKQLNLYSALLQAFFLESVEVWPVCNSWITQFYLPPTHKPYLL